MPFKGIALVTRGYRPKRKTFLHIVSYSEVMGLPKKKKPMLFQTCMTVKQFGSLSGKKLQKLPLGRYPFKRYPFLPKKCILVHERYILVPKVYK